MDFGQAFKSDLQDVVAKMSQIKNQTYFLILRKIVGC